MSKVAHTVLVTNTAEIPDKGSHVNITFRRKVHMNDDFLEDFHNVTTQYLEMRDSLMILVNTGIWHNNPKNFTAAMHVLTTVLLNLTQTLDTYSRPKSLAIVLAETTAQHFHTATGYYDKAIYNVTKEEPYCKPHDPISLSVSALDKDKDKDKSVPLDWRNDLLWDNFVQGSWGQAMIDHPHVLLEVLPLFTLTTSLADMHMRQHRQDCTHYCYTPMLYQPIYAQLKEASQRFLQL